MEGYPLKKVMPDHPGRRLRVTTTLLHSLPSLFAHPHFKHLGGHNTLWETRGSGGPNCQGTYPSGNLGIVVSAWQRCVRFLLFTIPTAELQFPSQHLLRGVMMMTDFKPVESFCCPLLACSWRGETNKSLGSWWLGMEGFIFRNTFVSRQLGSVVQKITGGEGL